MHSTVSSSQQWQWKKQECCDACNGARWVQVSPTSRVLLCQTLQYSKKASNVLNCGCKWQTVLCLRLYRFGRCLTLTLHVNHDFVLRPEGFQYRPTPSIQNVINYIFIRTPVHKCNLLHFLWGVSAKSHCF